MHKSLLPFIRICSSVIPQLLILYQATGRGLLSHPNSSTVDDLIFFLQGEELLQKIGKSDPGRSISRTASSKLHLTKGIEDPFSQTCSTRVHILKHSELLKKSGKNPMWKNLLSIYIEGMHSFLMDIFLTSVFCICE